MLFLRDFVWVTCRYVKRVPVKLQNAEKVAALGNFLALGMQHSVECSRQVGLGRPQLPN